MLYFIIENFVDFTLDSEEKSEIIPNKQIDIEEIIKKIVPEGSITREMCELGKKYYSLPKNSKKEIRVEIEEKTLCSIANFVEHTILEMKENQNER